MMTPTRRLVRFTLGLAATWIAYGTARLMMEGLEPLSIIPTALSALLALAALCDWLFSRDIRFIQIEREVAQTLPVGKPCYVKLKVHNPLPYPIALKLFDHHPPSSKALTAPPEIGLYENENAEVRYKILPIHRGDAQFLQTDIAALSRLGLWLFKVTHKNPQSVKIYPDFAAIAQLAGLEHDQQSAQMGLHLQQRRGEGMEFRQLRDFRKGDSLRRVDWKASSRMGKLIARDYQDERDQEIIFMLDCSRHLRARDGQLSHFDHCLNAALLTAYVALNKGDKVGLMTFSGQDIWVPPRSGQSSLPALIRKSYGLHSTLASPDYLSAASRLLSQQKRRSLVILLSNFHTTESEDLLAALQLIRRKHLVISASLREQYLDDRMENPVGDFNDALEYSGASEFILAREKMVNEMRTMGVYIIDSAPSELPIQLANQYMAMKRAGLC